MTQLLSELFFVMEQKKLLEAQEKTLKERIEKEMREQCVDKAESEELKVSITKASSSISIDLKKLQENEADLYNDLLKDYPKVTKRKSYLKVMVK